MIPRRDLEAFRQAVLGDPALLDELRAAPDLFAFLERMVRLGAERGYCFTTDDVRLALSRSRRAWLERWL
jgi:predicted ribosomally synthesized peptide with nif11-like leader